MLSHHDGTHGPWGQWHQGALVALADHGQDPMGVLHAKVGDLGLARLRHPQSVQGEQAGEGVVAGGGGLGRSQEPDRFLAVKPKRLRVTRHLGAANVGDGGVGEGTLRDRVAVEAGQGGQPPGPGGAAPAGLLKLADVGLDMGAADRRQPNADVSAPGAEVTQIGQIGAGRPVPALLIGV